jgi:GT2 family glycosyltransferase
MKPTTLDIVIVNWNTGGALRQCLESITKTRNDGCRLLRVCIVDNASTDNSLDGIENLELPSVVYRNSANRGFAAACNQGALGSCADYLLFLNPDTRLTPASLSVPTGFMQQEENRRVGICGIPLLDDSGEPGTCCAAFPSALLLCAESCGLHQLIGRRFASYRCVADPAGRRRTVDQVIGAYFLVRASLFERLGGFDDRFFVYYEEVDFSLRALAGGYTSCVLLGTVAYHTGCVSSGLVKDLSLFYSLRSKLQYAHKHLSIGGQVSVGLCTLLLEPWFRCLHAVCTGSTGKLNTTIRAYAYLFQDFLARLSCKVHKSLAL